MSDRLGLQSLFDPLNPVRLRRGVCQCSGCFRQTFIEISIEICIDSIANALEPLNPKKPQTEILTRQTAPFEFHRTLRPPGSKTLEPCAPTIPRSQPIPNSKTPQKTLTTIASVEYASIPTHTTIYFCKWLRSPSPVKITDPQSKRAKFALGIVSQN